MLELNLGFIAHCSACHCKAFVPSEEGDEDAREGAHVELRLLGWTRDASGAQFCPACAASR